MKHPGLRTVTRLQGNNAALVNGEITPAHFRLDFVDVPVLVQAFRRMVRTLEFDICEMALTTYLCAREHGVRFTALPIFLVRAFHHGAILRHAGSGIDEPSDLEGRAVGVNRGYTVTTGVWARAILQEEYGVDLGKVTWMLSGDEHVEAYRPPLNVRPIPEGASIEEMLVARELAAAVNITTDNPDIRPLIQNPAEAALAAYRSRGHYPINHLIVVRDDVLERYPQLARELFEAFAESKARYLRKLANGEIEKPGELEELYAKLLGDGDDPLPYGVEANRTILEELVGHAVTQEILAKPVAIESLFAESTLLLRD
ncbi:MAG: ABC transporter substrate-binding protein [Woeseiaceae bacterium]